MATLAEVLANEYTRSKLPAGMRNNNPGNIKYVGQKVAGIVGPSVNTDQGDPQAVFSSPEAGMGAMYRLLLKKYQGGKTTPNAMIAGNMGWTPGNYDAAANVARSAGIGPNDDIGLTDPTRAARFMRGLIVQEHGNSGNLYTDDMIRASLSGDALAPQSNAPVVNIPVNPSPATNVSAAAVNAAPVQDQPHTFTPPPAAQDMSQSAFSAMFNPQQTPGAIPFAPSSGGSGESTVAGLLSGLVGEVGGAVKNALYQPPDQKPVDGLLPTPELTSVQPTIAATDPTQTLEDVGQLPDMFQRLRTPLRPQVGSMFRPSRLA